MLLISTLFAASLLHAAPKFVTQPRRHPAPIAAAASAAGDWAASPPPPAVNRWQTIAGCDVLLPEERTPCTGIVHFVGGALVGQAPLQTYAPFLEQIGAGAGTSLCIVATPVQSLSGLDHWQAASEVMMRWCACKNELDQALFIRGDPSSDVLPVIGLGHSLGAKLIVLLGSDAKLCEALGTRCANVLVSFNNYSAKRSIPLLEQASTLGGALPSELRDAAGDAADVGRDVAASVGGGLGALGSQLGAASSKGLRGLSDALESGEGVGGELGARFGDMLGEGLDQLGKAIGTPQSSAAAAAGATGTGAGAGATGSSVAKDTMRSGLEQTASMLEMLGREAGAMGARTQADLGGFGSGDGFDAADADSDTEFVPNPEATDGLVLSSYVVGRNLLVRFASDGIDQSSQLARLLQKRFTDDVTGIGGRLDFRKLDGTHVTPNVPSLSGYLGSIDPTLAATMGYAIQLRVAVEAARRAEEEQKRACAAIVEFCEREVARATP